VRPRHHLRELIELAGGMKPGHNLRFWTPGGSSVPLLTAEHLDIPLDFEGSPRRSLLGTTATQIFSDQDCPCTRPGAGWSSNHARVVRKCTPVPRGQLLDGPHVPPDPVRQGTYADLDTLQDTADNVLRRSSADSATAGHPGDLDA